MELKDVLGEIEADGANLVHERLLEWALTPPLWHAEAVGGVHTIRAVILQGPYSASKHAVKAFTDVLRMELEESGAPVSVTLIKPSAIDTPYMEHARSYLESEGTKNPPPSYDPEPRCCTDPAGGARGRAEVA